MVTLTSSTTSAATALLLQKIAADSASSGTGPKPAATTPSGPASGAPADVVQLSDQAKAQLEQTAAAQTAVATIPTSLDELVAKQTDDLADSLTKAFAAAGIPADEVVRLQVDRFGNVKTEGPYKKKIDEVFKNDPELAKQLKTVAGLNALKAAQQSLDLYNAQKKATSDPKRQADAWTQYNIRAMNIQTLSGVMTLKDGKLRSAAVDYVDMIADPTGEGADNAKSDPVAAAKDAANRLS
jgi:hypothetical protein